MTRLFAKKLKRGWISWNLREIKGLSLYSEADEGLRD